MTEKERGKDLTNHMSFVYNFSNKYSYYIYGAWQNREIKIKPAMNQKAYYQTHSL